jgi:hypothetical protein
MMIIILFYLYLLPSILGSQDLLVDIGQTFGVKTFPKLDHCCRCKGLVS